MIDAVGDVARRGADLEFLHGEVDEAAVGRDVLGLALEVDRDRHHDFLVEVDLDEVDVLHRALDRVALDVLDQRRVHGAVDGEVEDRVHARCARERLAQLAAIDRHADRIHPVAVHDGGDLAVGAEATGIGASGAAANFGLENGLRHGDRLPSNLVTTPTHRAPGRYSSVPIYRPRPLPLLVAQPTTRQPFSKNAGRVALSATRPASIPGDLGFRRFGRLGEVSCRCGGLVSPQCGDPFEWSRRTALHASPPPHMLDRGLGLGSPRDVRCGTRRHRLHGQLTSGHAMSRWMVSPWSRRADTGVQARAGRPLRALRSGGARVALRRSRTSGRSVQPRLEARTPSLPRHRCARGSAAASAGSMSPRFQASSAARSNRCWLNSPRAPRAFACGVATISPSAASGGLPTRHTNG